MRHVNGVYAQCYNRSRKIGGQLFRGRYKSVLVEEDSHLLELLRYIHQNPLVQICWRVPWFKPSSIYILCEEVGLALQRISSRHVCRKKGHSKEIVPGIC